MLCNRVCVQQNLWKANFSLQKRAQSKNKELAGVFLQGLKVVMLSWFTDSGSERNPAFPPDYFPSDHCWLSGEIKLRRVTWLESNCGGENRLCLTKLTLVIKEWLDQTASIKKRWDKLPQSQEKFFFFSKWRWESSNAKYVEAMLVFCCHLAAKTGANDHGCKVKRQRCR